MSVRLKNGFHMPLVGFGTFLSKPEEVGQAVKAAIAAGYRHIDCAYMYGNETQIGATLAETFKQGIVCREDLFIVSKLWRTRHHPEDVKPSLQESLSMLGLNYLDLYLIHYPTPLKRGDSLWPKDDKGNLMFEDIHYLKTWKAMESCVDEGLVRSIGLSNFNSQQIQDVIDNGRIYPVNLQVEVHPYFQQEKLVDFCRQRDIVVTSYSSFGSPGWSAWKTASHLKSMTHLLADGRLASIGAKYGKTPAQVILRWLVQRQVVSIPKSVTPSRIQENIRVFDFELLSDDMAAIKELDKNTRLMATYEECNGKLVLAYSDAPYFPYGIPF